MRCCVPARSPRSTAWAMSPPARIASWPTSTSCRRATPAAPSAWKAATLAESDEERAGVEAMLGLAAADTGAHERALAHLQRSVELSERTGSHQQAAFSLSFVGRSHFLREEVDEARAALERSLALARETRWVAFEPWPESWLAEADLAAGHLPEGRERFEHAWALASELGDPSGREPPARASAGSHARKAGCPPGCAFSRRHGGARRASPTPTSGSRPTPSRSWPSRRSKQDTAAHANGSRISSH